MAVYITSGGSGGGGSPSIPELTSDPVSPVAETAWVLATTSGGGGGGSPIGLLLSLTYAGSMTISYQLSYRTLEGTTVRTSLT